MKRNTQLKLNDRIRIETYLEEQMLIKKICKALNVLNKLYIVKFNVIQKL